MLVKTSELTGAALDWSVRYANSGFFPKDYVEARDNFSTCWNKGGPIIDRERISIEYTGNAGRSWFAKPPGNPTRKRNQMKDGPTPLIAAMRCYVASKLGDTVEIPDELFA